MKNRQRYYDHSEKEETICTVKNKKPQIEILPEVTLVTYAVVENKLKCVTLNQKILSEKLDRIIKMLEK